MIKKRYIEWIREPQRGEQIFLLAYILYLGVSVWATTMFPMMNFVKIIGKLLFVPMVVLKILLYDGYQRKQLIIIIFVTICSFLVLFLGHQTIHILWLILILGTRNVSFEKILKSYLVVTGAIFFLAFAASLLGVIENLQYVTETRGIRNSFGTIYPTDFAAHVFYWIVTYFYLMGERLKSWHYIGTAIVAALIYYFCNARLDSGCILFIAILYGIGNALRKSRTNRRIKHVWEHTWMRFGMLVMPLLAIFSILITVMYRKGSRGWDAINKFSNGRVALGKTGFTDYGVKLFGQNVVMKGFGGNTELVNDYFFLDCSYVNILICYGIVILIIVLGLHVYCCYKNRFDLYFLYAIALIALNCIFAHHLLEAAYNPFLLAILTEGIRKPEKHIKFKPFREYMGLEIGGR